MNAMLDLLVDNFNPAAYRYGAIAINGKMEVHRNTWILAICIMAARCEKESM
jgi:hypothetical protein